MTSWVQDQLRIGVEVRKLQSINQDKAARLAAMVRGIFKFKVRVKAGARVRLELQLWLGSC